MVNARSRKVIEVAHFGCSVNGREILKDIAFDLHAGEFLTVVGPNGAGKTTLLRCLVRIIRGGGGIRVMGRELESYRQKELAKILAYVPQEDRAGIPFSVREFVMMGRYPYLSPFAPPGQKDREAVARALDVTGTREFEDRMLDSLSGGERQRVSLAAAMAQEPRVLLLDEPTSFLDPGRESGMRRLLSRICRERGLAVLSVTHDLNLAVLTGDRVMALKNGRVAFLGCRGTFADNRVLEDLFDTSFLFASHPQTGDAVFIPESIS